MSMDDEVEPLILGDDNVDPDDVTEDLKDWKVLYVPLERGNKISLEHAQWVSDHVHEGTWYFDLPNKNILRCLTDGAELPAGITAKTKRKPRKKGVVLAELKRDGEWHI